MQYTKRWIYPKPGLCWRMPSPMYKPYNFHKVSGLVGAWALARHLLDDIPVVSRNSNDYQAGPIEHSSPRLLRTTVMTSDR